MKAKRWLIAAVLVCGLLGLGLLGSNRWPGPDEEATEPPATAEARGDGFPFAADRGEKLLGQLLPPSEQEVGGRLAAAAEPHRFPDLASRRLPEAPPTPLQPELPPLPVQSPAHPVRPRTLPEEPPLARNWFAPPLPENPQLAVSPGVRLPSPHPDQPPPVPPLAHPLSERGSVDHPTAEFSTATALAAPLPERTRPVPFVRLALPDPFEHAQAVRLQTPPPDVDPPTAITRLPGR